MPQVGRGWSEVSADRGALARVFEKLRPYWYAQLDGDGAEIELSGVNQRNVSLETPLIVAAQYLGPTEIQILIEHGADIDAQSESEQHHAALHVARLMRRFDNATKLVELGANAELLDNIGKSPLDYGNLQSERTADEA